MSESVSTNPYASPVVPENPRAIQRTRVATRVRIPAGCLLAGATLHLATMLAVMAVVFQMNPDRPKLFVELGILNAIAFAIYFLEQSFLVYAAIRMWRMESLLVCRVAAIFACLPLLTPGTWFGIPLGIWAAIVLFMPSTAKEFDFQAGRDEVVGEEDRR